MAAKIRIGVVGCGYWGPNHLRVFSQLSGSTVTAFADLDAKRLATIGAQYPDAKGYSDFKALNASDYGVAATPVLTGLKDTLTNITNASNLLDIAAMVSAGKLTSI